MTTTNLICCLQSNLAPITDTIDPGSLLYGISIFFLTHHITFPISQFLPFHPCKTSRNWIGASVSYLEKWRVNQSSIVTFAAHVERQLEREDPGKRDSTDLAWREWEMTSEMYASNLHRTKISPAKAISALFRKNAFLRFVNSINIALVSYQVRTSRRFSIHNEPSDSMNIQCTPFRFRSHRTAAVQAISAELWNVEKW